MANELNIQLDPFSQTGLTLLGRVYDKSGTEQTGSPVTMSEVSTGLYSGDLVVSTFLDDSYSVRFETNTPDKLYGTGELYVRDGSEVSQENFFDGALDTVANVTLVATTTTNTDMRGTDSANTIAPDNAGIIANGNAIAALNDVAATDIVSAGAITTLGGAVVNVDLVDTCTTNTDQRGTDGANTIAPDNAGITANGNAISSLNDFNPTTDTVANVTTVQTTVTNTDMRGTDGANTVTPPTVGQIDTELTNLHGSGSWQTGSGGSTPADVWAFSNRTLTEGTKDSEIDDIKSKTDQMNFTGSDIQSISSNMRGTDGANTVTPATPTDINNQTADLKGLDDRDLTEVYDKAGPADLSSVATRANQDVINENVKKSSLIIPASDDLPDT